MPSCKVFTWTCRVSMKCRELDGPAVPKVRKGSSHEALIILMSTRLPGETAMAIVKNELSLTDSALKKLKEVLRNPDHPTTRALRDIGVRYFVRGKEAYLMRLGGLGRWFSDPRETHGAREHRACHQLHHSNFPSGHAAPGGAGFISHYAYAYQRRMAGRLTSSSRDKRFLTPQLPVLPRPNV
jgi:hypothetical protein